MVIIVQAAGPSGTSTAGAISTSYFAIITILSKNTHMTQFSTHILVHTHRGEHRGFRTRARKQHMVGITSLNVHGRGVVSAICIEAP